MAFTVGDLYSDIRKLHKRGTSLDDEIPGAVRRAVRWLESNYTLQYMRRIFKGTVAAGGDEIELPKVPFKAIHNLRLTWPDGSFRKLVASDTESDREDEVAYDPMPVRYVLDGMERLVLDRSVASGAPVRGTIIRYSDFPTAEGASHWLLANAESFLRCQTMLELATFLRDDRTFQVFIAMRDQQLTVLQNADYEARFAGQEIVLGGG